ncbi:hypothetical protein ABT324_02365 [Saccharopolyspora sp. NPDC000359]|uniref:hypothetical protein n=1 Tax=Saccharopolyspora sp. NPDC000359 TaxID=3154251 RepID=UPI00332BAEF2
MVVQPVVESGREFLVGVLNEPAFGPSAAGGVRGQLVTISPTRGRERCGTVDTAVRGAPPPGNSREQ